MDAKSAVELEAVVEVIREALRDAGFWGYWIVFLGLLALFRVTLCSIRLFAWQRRDAASFIEALERHVRAGNIARALVHSEGHHRLFIGRLAIEALSAVQRVTGGGNPGDPDESRRAAHAVRGSVRETLARLEPEIDHGLALLPVLSRIALALGGIGFVINGAAYYPHWPGGGPVGIMSIRLQGYGEALNNVVFGVSVAAVCTVADLVLSARVQQVRIELRMVATRLGQLFDTALEERSCPPAAFRARARRSRLPSLPAGILLPGSATMAVVTTLLLGLMLKAGYRVMMPESPVPWGWSLPVSSSTLVMNDGVTLALNGEEARVDDRRVIRFSGLVLTAADLDALQAALVARREYRQRIESMGGPRFEGSLLLAVDRQVPYVLLHQTLEVAAGSGFRNFNLVTYAP